MNGDLFFMSPFNHSRLYFPLNYHTMDISTSRELELSIAELQQKKVVQAQLLKDDLLAAKEWIRPKNILKRTVANIVQVKPGSNTLLKAGAGIGAVILFRKKIGKVAKNVAGFALPGIVRKLLPF